MADGRVRATSRGRERGRAELRRSPAPGPARRPPRPPQRGRRQPSHSSEGRFAALPAPARVYVFATLFVFLLKVGRLHLDPKSIQEKRHPDHRGQFRRLSPPAALGSPVLRPCPRPVAALLWSLLLWPARNSSGSKQPGFRQSLSSPCLFPSSTMCTYGSFLIWNIVYMFLLSAWGKKYIEIIFLRVFARNNPLSC